MLEIRGPPVNVIGKLFVGFLIALLAFQHPVKKGRSIFGLCLARDRSIRATMYLGATLLDVQALRKAAENFRVLIFPLFLTTLFITPIYCLVYRRRKYAKILLVVQNLKIALKKTV